MIEASLANHGLRKLRVRRMERIRWDIRPLQTNHLAPCTSWIPRFPSETTSYSFRAASEEYVAHFFLRFLGFGFGSGSSHPSHLTQPTPSASIVCTGQTHMTLPHSTTWNLFKCPHRAHVVMFFTFPSTLEKHFLAIRAPMNIRPVQGVRPGIPQFHNAFMLARLFF